jgi:DNA-binding response OmpR family regulator
LEAIMDFDDARHAGWGQVVSSRFHTRSCVLLLQSELLAGVALATQIKEQGYEVAGPYTRLSRAQQWLDTHTPQATILDVALADGTSFGLARLLTERGIPVLFYSAFDAFEQMPVEVRELPFLEKPTHQAILMRLLPRLINRGAAAPPGGE